MTSKTGKQTTHLVDASKVKWGFTGEQAILPTLYGTWHIYRPRSEQDFRERILSHIRGMDERLKMPRRVAINSALHTYGYNMTLGKDSTEEEWADAYLALYRCGLVTLCYNPDDRSQFKVFVNPRNLSRANLR